MVLKYHLLETPALEVCLRRANLSVHNGILHYILRIETYVNMNNNLHKIKLFTVRYMVQQL